MKDKIQHKLHLLSKEIEILTKERETLSQRDREIEVRIHQIVGAVFELQQLIDDLDHPSGASE